MKSAKRRTITLPITEADYLAGLEASLVAEPPAGAFTVAAVVQRTGKPRRTITDALSRDVSAGTLATGMFVSGGKLTRYYWVA